MRTDILGVQYDNVTMQEAVDAAAVLLEEQHTSYVVTPNAEIAYEAIRDAGLRDILNDAALVLPDGSGVVLASKIVRKPLKEKVAGVDFADRLLAYAAQQSKPVFLFGSKPGIAEAAAETMKKKHPGLLICGVRNGYYTDETPILEEINRSGAQILFVCLGAPKQERFMAEHSGDLNVRMMIGLGGTLDSYAGTVKRAPKWMIRMNLEWFYRLCKQPSRLGRMMRLPKYVLAALRERRKGTGNG